jgi:outer membrane protein assembly factor BamA
MRSQQTLRRGLPFIFLLVLGPLTNRAQISPKLQNCSGQAASHNALRSAQVDTVHPKVRIEVVTFEGESSLSQTIKEQIVEAVKQANFDWGSDWTGHLEDVVREVLQQHGYFYSHQNIESHVISAEPQIARVSVTIHISQGGQYRLKEIRFKNAAAFPVEQLRSQFALQDGDIFDLRKIRQGFEALVRQYSRQGYINLTASPDLYPDNGHRLISMTVELDKGEQFRVGSVKILGLDPKTANDGLKTKLKEGDVFDAQLVRDFYIDNKSVLPADATSDLDTEVKQDPQNDTVAIVFDFRSCPRGSK